MKKLIFLTFFLSSILNFDETKWFELFQADYFVDAVNGNDSNSGTYPWKAWKTLTKVNNTTFTAGDRIGFEGNFEGTITVGQSGTINNPIVFKSYGDGAVIYGSTPLVGWVKRSNTNVYVLKYAAADITQLFVNGKRMREARYPNTGYDYIETVNTSSSFTSNELNASINYAGAKWLGRTDPYVTPTRSVVSSSSKTLTLDSAPYAGLTATTEGFVLFNKFEFLDEAGEFYYNSVTDSLYYLAEGNVDPDTFTDVRGSTVDYGFNVNNKNYITVKDLEFTQQKSYGVRVVGNSDYVTIIGNTCTLQDSAGIYMDYSGTYNNIIKNIVKHANHQGIEIKATNSVISENYVDSTCIFTQLGKSGTGNWFMGSGMYVEGADNLIQRNKIYNSGYNGIHFASRNIVDRNYIKNCNLTKDDGGGIYTSASNVYPASSSANGSIISNNIIDGSWGTLSGYTFLGYTLGEGIYIDQWASGIKIKGNIVANVTSGAIYAHYGYDHIISNNITYRAKDHLVLKVWGYNTQVKKNKSYGFSRDYNDDQSERMIWKYGVTTRPVIDSNTYIQHYKNADIFLDSITARTFASWQSATGKDVNSTVDNSALAANYSEILVYNPYDRDSLVYWNNATNLTDAFDGTTPDNPFILTESTGKVLVGLNTDCIGPLDNVAPVIKVFDIPSTGTLTINVNTFTAVGGATKYKLTESTTPPTLESAGWSTSVPTTYTFGSAGSKTLYAWCRDAAGNVSNYANDNTTVTIDLTTGLIAWYDFEDNGTTLVDESANTLNGVNNNNAGADRNVTTVTGMPGQAYPYISTGLRQSNIADEASTNFTGAFTIYAWINVASLSGNRTVLAKNSEFVWMVTTTGVLQMRVYENGGANYVTIASPSSTISIGTNYLVEVHCNGGNTRESYSMSINRSAVSPTYGGDIGNLTNGISDTSNDINIGYFSTLTAAMNGNISQLIIYNYDTSSGLSDGIYNSGSGRAY